MVEATIMTDEEVVTVVITVMEVTITETVDTTTDEEEDTTTTDEIEIETKADPTEILLSTNVGKEQNTMKKAIGQNLLEPILKKKPYSSAVETQVSTLTNMTTFQSKLTVKMSRTTSENFRKVT